MSFYLPHTGLYRGNVKVVGHQLGIIMGFSYTQACSAVYQSLFSGETRKSDAHGKRGGAGCMGYMETEIG